MGNLRWAKFSFQAWKGDAALRLCSIGARGFWMELLCIAHDADQAGRVLISGMIPTAAQLGKITGCTEEEAAGWMAELEANNVFSRDESGCIISRRMMREMMHIKTCIKNGKLGGNRALFAGVNPDSDSDSESDKDSNASFDAFWTAYPRKVGKGAARKAWRAAVKKVDATDDIIAAVKSQKFDARPEFIPHPSTWLNQERWLDEGTGTGNDLPPPRFL